MRKGTIAVAATLLVWVGCGGDDGTADAGSDGGPGSRDAAQDASRDSGIPTDAGVDSGTYASTCDPWDEISCSAGEKCSLLRRPAATPEDARFWFECVPESLGTKVEGLPCGIIQIREQGTDLISTNDCRQGLECGTGPGETINRCVPLCRAPDHPCADTHVCIGPPPLPNEFVGGCLLAHDCDPVFQRGCPSGRACYLIWDGSRQRLAATCLAAGDMTPAGGSCPAVEFPGFSPCEPGSQCFPDRLPDGGIGDDLRCRPFCALGPTPDAGVPADASVGVDAGPEPSGDCAASEECVMITVEGLMNVRAPTPTGICN